MPASKSQTARSEPRAEPTSIPRGYGAPRSAKKLLPWSWARERLDRALGYWLVTVGRDGRPHAIPTWGAWAGDRFYCEGSPETRYARNIERDPRVVLHLESADEVVIVEGIGARAPGPGGLRQVPRHERLRSRPRQLANGRLLGGTTVDRPRVGPVGPGHPLAV
jgi:pyridoxamine 5'-phosphate oxidase-like protein